MHPDGIMLQFGWAIVRDFRGEVPNLECSNLKQRCAACTSRGPFVVTLSVIVRGKHAISV